MYRPTRAADGGACPYAAVVAITKCFGPFRLAPENVARVSNWALLERPDYRAGWSGLRGKSDLECVL